jgi:hypothetical protein
MPWKANLVTEKRLPFVARLARAAIDKFVWSDPWFAVDLHSMAS